MNKYESVNGVVVTCNPSKVELRVRFPLNAIYGWLAQWIARQPSELKVLGSSPRSIVPSFWQ
jgi:hypothetical protein